MFTDRTLRISSTTFITAFALLFMMGCTGGCNQGTGSDDKSGKDTTAQKGADGTTGAAGTKSAIQPPIPEADPPYHSYSIDPTEDTTIRYPTGSKIHIPPKAFLTKDGEVVKEEVELRYREMHDPIGFFAAGVPMTIEQNGKEKVFESAGMCDIRANMKVESESGGQSTEKERKQKSSSSGKAKKERTEGEKGKGESEKRTGDKANGRALASVQNGNGASRGPELKVNPERKIEVEMASEVEGDYPVYHMNEETGEWEQTSDGPGKTEPFSSDEPLVSAKGDIGYDADLSKPDPSPPRKIKLFNLQRIDMQEVDIDETNYKGGKQKLRTENAGSSTLTEHYLTFVHDARAVRGSKKMDRITVNTIEQMKGHLLMPTSQGDCEFPRYVTRIHAQKLPQSSSFYKVTVWTKENGGRKKTCICKRVPSIETLKKGLKKEWEKYRKAAARYNRKMDSLSSSSTRSEQMAAQVESKVRRVFQVEGFGPVNCDDPKRFPDDAKLVANFKTESGKSLILPRFKLATLKPKMLVRYKEEKLKFDPAMTNLLWGITDKGALAYCPPERFEKVDPKKEMHTFRMKVEQEVDSYEELREILMPESSS